MSAPTLPDAASTGTRPLGAVGARTAVLLAVLSVLAVAPYLAGVLVPYYVNDLDALPLDELTSGAHDPKDLWPQGTVGAYVQAAGFFSLVLTPVGLLIVLAGAVTGLAPWRRRTSRAVTAGLVLVVAVCVAGLAMVWGPLGTALTTWRLD